jgi:NADH-ubiquinone oxidoreductase chain 6
LYSIKQQNQYIYNMIDYKQLTIYASSNNWETVLMDVTNITSIGNIMYSTYSIWLLIVSIILLLAMVGVIAITISEKKA